VAAYVALAAVFILIESANEGAFITIGGTRYWLAAAMACLMSLFGLYLAVLAVASIIHRQFPAPSIPVIHPTFQRRDKSAIEAAVICLLGAAGLFILPAIFIWGSVRFVWG
jgi:hypothetical protein